MTETEGAKLRPRTDLHRGPVAQRYDLSPRIAAGGTGSADIGVQGRAVCYVRNTSNCDVELPERKASADDEDGACDEGAGVAGEQERERRDGDR